MQCARCGHEIGELQPTERTCPRCGAPQPDPNWTMPYSSSGAQATIQSRQAATGGLAPGKKYALVIVQGADPGSIVPIEKPRVVIGRAECDIVLKDPELSRQHALIAINGMSARLEDLGSTNGTFVDGQRIQAVELADRSEFRVGTTELLFVMRDDDL